MELRVENINDLEAMILLWKDFSKLPMEKQIEFRAKMEGYNECREDNEWKQKRS